MNVRFKTSIKLPASHGDSDTHWINVNESCRYTLAYHVTEKFLSIERDGQMTIVPVSNVQHMQTR